MVNRSFPTSFGFAMQSKSMLLPPAIRALHDLCSMVGDSRDSPVRCASRGPRNTRLDFWECVTHLSDTTVTHFHVFGGCLNYTLLAKHVSSTPSPTRPGVRDDGYSHGLVSDADRTEKASMVFQLKGNVLSRSCNNSALAELNFRVHATR